MFSISEEDLPKICRTPMTGRENFSHNKLLLSMTASLVFYYSKIGLALGEEKLSEYSFHSDWLEKDTKELTGQSRVMVSPCW